MFFWRKKPKSGAQSEDSGHSTSKPEENLDHLKAAVANMATEDIENLLDMGASLKPGREALFRAELERRQAADSDSAQDSDSD